MTPRISGSNHCVLELESWIKTFGLVTRNTNLLGQPFTHLSSVCWVFSAAQSGTGFSATCVRSASTTSPILNFFIISRASELWPTSSNDSLALRPPCSRSTSSPPGCYKLDYMEFIKLGGRELFFQNSCLLHFVCFRRSMKLDNYFASNKELLNLLPVLLILLSLR